MRTLGKIIWHSPFLGFLLVMGICLFSVISCNNKKIPVLSTTEVTNITETTAMSGGDISDEKGNPVTKRGVCWSTEQNPTIQNNKTEDGSGVGNFTSSISDLEHHTTYYIRSYATNSKGTGYGNPISFTTKGTFTDSRDGNVYKTVKIGNQIWMAENLRYLPSMSNSQSNTTPCYYVYGYFGSDVNEAKTKKKYITYGVLYNWSAASSSCPSGWHLPSNAEWQELIDYLGGGNVAGNKLKETGNTHWDCFDHINQSATNKSGFTALPGGRFNGNGSFDGGGTSCYWWSSTWVYDCAAIYWGMSCKDEEVKRDDILKELGFSVRCIKD